MIIEYDEKDGDAQVLTKEELTKLNSSPNAQYTCSWQKKNSLYIYDANLQNFKLKITNNQNKAFYVTLKNLIFTFQQIPPKLSSPTEMVNQYLYNQQNLYKLGGYIWESFTLKKPDTTDESQFDAECKNQKLYLIPNINYYSNKSKVWCLNGKVQPAEINPPCVAYFGMTMNPLSEKFSMCTEMSSLIPQFLFSNGHDNIQVKGNKMYDKYQGFNGKPFDNSIFIRWVDE